MKDAITKFSKEVDKDNGFLAVLNTRLEETLNHSLGSVSMQACKFCINESLKKTTKERTALYREFLGPIFN